MNASQLYQPVDIAVVNDEERIEMSHTSQHSRALPASDIIPLPKCHIRRTPSEQQLYDDMANAEWREECMFRRLVNGMQRRQVDICASQYRHDQKRRELHGANERIPMQPLTFGCNNTMVSTKHCEQTATSTEHKIDFRVCSPNHVNQQELRDNVQTYDSLHHASFGFLPVTVTPPPQQHCGEIIDAYASSDYRVPSTLVANNDGYVGEIFDFDM
mmetsp:Transcript_21300/g.31368  ORF Transcript_21300/g.31368 Transcript_21300/m.31368 type:complete len:215 (-) Transcript_21300:245-889(-)